MTCELPHHRFRTFATAKRFVSAVIAADIRDAHLRKHALNAAKSACLNIAEATGRRSAADQARVFGIALGETVEAVAAVEIAAATGSTSTTAEQRVVAIGRELGAALGKLSRAR